MGFLASLKAIRSLPELAAANSSPNALQVASPFSTYPNHLNQVVWPDLVGLENVLPMSRVEAMAVPAMARARRIIAGSIARMPLRAYKGDDLLSAQPLWIDRTDGQVSPFHRMLWTVDDLLFYGWSLWGLSRDSAGLVISAARIPWERWEFDTFGRIVVDGELAADRDVCLIPGVDEGVLYFAQRAIRHAAKLIAAADKVADTPAANLELHQTTDAPMTQPEIDALVSAWAAARRGAHGGVAYTNHAIELREHGAPNEHLLIEGRNAAAVDIARAAGIPAASIDATGPTASLTYETTQGRNAELVDYGLAPYMSAVSARLGMDDMTPRGTRIAFDTEDFVGPAIRVQVPDDGGPTPTRPAPAAPGAAPAPGAATPTPAGVRQ
ncbi:phage portal protein [Nocardia amikacinitolerans]|uniref:phage portal protein n=1 Tax=Nocardia amikacinitolerans TaxID=756689 RepID=UPI0020A3EEB0|nr:phage portal protein [Nocardia amikacinitolerans]MCP2281072.1 Phage portal protein BeeE [Nocardia amikacinitolerans]